MHVRIIRKCQNYYKDNVIIFNKILINKNVIYVLNEKLEIPLYKGGSLLNQKKELISKCLHQHKLMLLHRDSNERK